MSKVLALKYRPSSFDKIIGQEAVASTLSLALSQNRLSHAYLFSGLRGSGKTSTARIFAKALVCDNGPTATPCETCENCKMANENRHIDIIEMDAASSRKIDDIRDLIEQTKYKPNIARFKVFIIDEVHMLTREAFNALLKTLEEPPEYIKFILATTDPLKLPATILSRTQHFRFKQISKSDTIKHLSNILNLENIRYTQDALEMIARAGNGSLRDTLTLLDQAIIYSNSNLEAQNVASMLGLLDPKKIEDIFDIIFKEDRKKILEICKELESYECETIIDELIAYLKDRFFEQDVKYSTMICERFLRILSEAKTLLFLNSNEDFVLIIIFFKMMEALSIKKIDDMIESLEKSQPLTSKNDIQNTTKNIKDDYIKKETSVANSHVDIYDKFLSKIYDRSIEVGECFEKSVSFVSFSDNTLVLNSTAQDKCKQVLRQSSAVIKHLIKDVFGIETKLVMNQIAPQKIENIDTDTQENDILQNNSDAAGNTQETTNEESSLNEHPFVQKAFEILGK